MKNAFVVFIFGLILGGNAFSKNAEIPTAPHVDLEKYLGKWYEVASIPQSFQRKCVRNTFAEYSMSEDNLIKVLNSCDTQSGDKKFAEGRAKVIELEHNSKLKVTFVKLIRWIFAFGGNYWILDVAPNYSYALVGDPTLKYAWILSRTPAMDKTIFIEIESKYRALGYDTCKILTSIQSEGLSEREPLCEFVKK